MPERDSFVLLPIELLWRQRNEAAAPGDDDLGLPPPVSADAHAVVGAEHERLQRNREDQPADGGRYSPLDQQAEDDRAGVEGQAPEENPKTQLERPASFPLAIDGRVCPLRLLPGGGVIAAVHADDGADVDLFAAALAFAFANLALRDDVGQAIVVFVVGPGVG